MSAKRGESMATALTTITPLTVSKSTSLRSLPLPPSALEDLRKASFHTVGDLDGLSPSELAEELNVEGANITADDAQKLMLMARTGGLGTSSSSAAGASSSSAPRAAAYSALALLEEERHSGRVKTAAREFDELLGGGVPLKQITEFAGQPGVGKTQLGMQLALNVQIPTAFGGLGGRAVYIDTEGSFLAPRCLEMAEALVQRLRADAASATQHSAAAALHAHALLDRIAVYRVHDVHEQLGVLKALSASGPQDPPLRLLVLDSVAFHFRHADLDFRRRTALLGETAHTLSLLADRPDREGGPLAAVCINQVTTKVNDAVSTSSLVPALGEQWAHMCNVQLTLQWRDGMRLAQLSKGRKPGEAVYAVTAEGLRSPNEPAAPAQPLALPAPPPQAQQQPLALPPPPQPYALLPPPPMYGAQENRSFQQQPASGNKRPGPSYNGGGGGSMSAMGAPPPPAQRHQPHHPAAPWQGQHYSG